MKHKLRFLTFVTLVLGMTACNTKNSTSEKLPDLPQIKEEKVLKVLTLYSSTSYFLYRDEEMGYDYELIRSFAESQGLTVEIVVAESVNKLIQLLNEGKGDVIAYDIPITKEQKNDIIYCGQEIITHQVLVQQIEKGTKPLKNVIELVGKDVYIESGTKYEERIRNLNNELGGGINIHTMNKDTLTTEDLIGMVSTGEIPYTVTDNNIARLNKTYYNNIDISLAASFSQRSSWAVRKDSPLLAQAINEWIQQTNKTTVYKSILKRYFEYSKRPYTTKILSVKNGQISIFDPLFKKYAGEIDWDWRLIASQAYHESRFDTTATSWAGAQGLMQLMPATARAFGVKKEDILNPEINLKAAIETIKTLNKSFSKIQNKKERIKFILAAYNSGIGHVYDAMALAQKYGKNPLIWDDNVADYILLKGNPEYFNDPVCKFGYFRGRETYNYVTNVLEQYDEYKEKIAR